MENFGLIPVPEWTARRAYEAYAEFTDGKTWDGRDMPTWLDLGERIQRAWIAAAASAYTVGFLDGSCGHQH